MLGRCGRVRAGAFTRSFACLAETIAFLAVALIGLAVATLSILILAIVLRITNRAVARFRFRASSRAVQARVHGIVVIRILRVLRLP